jgi:hypothetical protein
MSDEPERALDEIAEDQRKLADGLEADVKKDVEKAKVGGGRPKRPWWKVWART